MLPLLSRKYFHPRLLLLAIVLLIVSTIPTCAGQQSEEDTTCIALVRAGEFYDLKLDSKEEDIQHTVTFSFNHKETPGQRLTVKSPYDSVMSEIGDGVYQVLQDQVALCTMTYVGLETVLLGEERVRLTIQSQEFFVRLVGVHMEESKIDVKLPDSLRIILSLCSLLPFFLLIPDALEDLQLSLDAESTSAGVYGRILSVLLPLLTVGLTFLLVVQGLAFLG